MTDWPRPVVHFEIVARDPDALAPFYHALFHWEIAEGPIRFFAAGLGGPEPGPNGHLRRGDTPGVTLFIQVADVAATQSACVELGGTITLAPLQLDGGPMIAGIRDPEGNPITLVQE